tara:strand:+ start:183 stop:329 length:147 start_codon:yes stop_codon:yes gene_type:complete
MKDKILEWIEKISGFVYNWAWDKRWKRQDPDRWIKGYRKWKKSRCPHN